MRNVTPGTIKEKGSAGSQAIFVPQEQVYEVKDAKFVHSIQLAFMFITNLSMTVEGQKHILGEDGDPKLKGAILENFFEMFNYFAMKTEFDFVANILSNVSALKVGREFLIEEKMFSKIVLMVKDNVKE